MIQNRKNIQWWLLDGLKCLADPRGQGKMARLVWDDRKATVTTQITTRWQTRNSETHLWVHNMWSLEWDGLPQQHTTPGATPVWQQREATIPPSSPKRVTILAATFNWQCRDLAQTSWKQGSILLYINRSGCRWQKGCWAYFKRFLFILYSSYYSHVVLVLPCPK